MPVEEAAQAVSLPTILLLLAFIVVSAQLRLDGIQDAVVAAVGALPYTRLALLAALCSQGVVLQNIGPLLVLGAGLSKLVSPVPAVLLLMPHIAGGSGDAGARPGVVLPMARTFAGNFLLLGSTAHLIVANLAERAGVRLD